MARWTEGWAVGASELGPLHRHCYSCFSLRRCSREDDACAPEACPLGCGARYHACKAAEHKLLCPDARAPCLNAALGCDVVLVRREMVEHLVVCPASIVACTQEWNRWPVHCRERTKAVPFRQRNPQAGRGQLDYELALRDQATVAGLHRAPRRTKLALRNNLTRRFPALPLPRVDSRVATTDCSDKALREVARPEVGEGEVQGYTYGIAKVFLRNQETQRRRWQEDVDTAILRTGQPVPKKYWEHPELEKGEVHPHCAYCYATACPREQGDSKACAVISCSWGCGAALHHCKAAEHMTICPTYEKETEFDWMHKGLPVPVGHIKRQKEKVEVLKASPGLLAPPCSLPEPLKRAGGRAPPPPAPPHTLHAPMRFDIKVETVTRLQVKPRSMYTFLCSAELRRDQWSGHCRNVHSDIHGGLNNWLEARCPLAAAGCGFSARRLYPGTDPRASIVYCQATQSFGVLPPPPAVTPGGGLLLAELPAELLHLILAFLEPRSLGAVALVSHQLRAAAAALLDSRGCVALQWERREGRGGGWEVAYRRWFFSPHFQPVSQWGLHR